MNGSLAQLVCLATYGRRWLAAPYAEQPPDPHLRNSAFRYVAEVTFTGGGRWGDVPSWLEGLRDRGAKALWLYVEPDPAPGASLPMPDAVAFANGADGTWGLVARTDSGQELWRPVWSTSRAVARDRGPWSVEYVGTGSDVAVPVPSLSGAEAALLAAIDESEMTARDLGDEMWARWFARARGASGGVRIDSDLVPPDFPPERRRLATLAQQAWPFGGMGSWNELVGGGHPVAVRLYAAILYAFAAVANG